MWPKSAVFRAISSSSAQEHDLNPRSGTPAGPPVSRTMGIVELYVNTSCSSPHMNSTAAVLFINQHFTEAGRVEAPVLAWVEILVFALLAHGGGIPTPSGRVGKLFFWVHVLLSLVQMWLVLVSLASFVTGMASFSAAHASCLTPWLHGHTYFDMVAFGTLGFQPQLLAYACIILMYACGLLQAQRVWCCIHLGRDVVNIEKFPLLLLVGMLAYTVFSFLVFLGSMSVLFSIVFLPIVLVSFIMLYVVGFFMTWLRYATAGEGSRNTGSGCGVGHWPPVKALHEATSFFHTLLMWFGGQYDDDDAEEGGLVETPILLTFLLLAFSPLVMWGTPLTLHVYAGNTVTANNALITDAYASAFQWDFALPQLELRWPDTLQWPQISWGPVSLMQNAGAMLALTALVGVLKSLLSMITTILGMSALCGEVLGLAHNVPVSMLAAGNEWDKVSEVLSIASGAEKKKKERVSQKKKKKGQQQAAALAQEKMEDVGGTGAAIDPPHANAAVKNTIPNTKQYPTEVADAAQVGVEVVTVHNPMGRDITSI
jgi:hypothetical protein